MARMCAAAHIHAGKRCPVCSRSGSSRPELDRYPRKKLRAQVRARDGNRCRNCGATEKLSAHHLQRGGPDRMDNLVTCVLAVTTPSAPPSGNPDEQALPQSHESSSIRRLASPRRHGAAGVHPHRLYQ
jgi:hypothetical protein